MISVAIVGILAAIATPLFSLYRGRSFDASAKTQLHNLMLTEQAIFSINNNYVAVPAGIGPGMMGVLPNQSASKGVGYIVHLPVATNGARFTAYTGHEKGSRIFAGSENNGPFWRITRANMTAVQDAQSQPNIILSSTWGNR